MDFTVNELLSCVRREIAYRRKVYPRLIDEDRMDRVIAEREIAMMSAIAELLEAKEQPKLL